VARDQIAPWKDLCGASEKLLSNIYFVSMSALAIRHLLKKTSKARVRERIDMACSIFPPPSIAEDGPRRIARKDK
jgi:hypothetical protein